MNGFEDALAAREKVISAALDVVSAERRTAHRGALEEATRASRALVLAARELTEATDALPLERQPRGWARKARAS